MEKDILAEMTMAYAVGTMAIDGELYYLAGSEHRDGNILLLHPEGAERVEISESVGGVMALLGVEEGAFLSLEGFYPIFDSATAAVYHTSIIGELGNRTVVRTKLFDLPWAHRISLMRTSDGLFLVAGTLCKTKEFQDDWSTKGSVSVCSYERGTVGPLTNIFDQKITKHHGMWREVHTDKNDEIYVTGTEGVFRISYDNGAWMVDQVLKNPTSDVTVGDFDGDGKKKFAIIEEFHGDVVRIFAGIEKHSEPLASLETRFGHVLHYEVIDNTPTILLGERAQEKALWRLHLVHEGKEIHLEKELIDCGGGPAQLTVARRRGIDELIVTNHGENQVVRYRLA
jgi:hypothetical protein